ncbi:c-type cytochrome [Algicella marina]|uniref:Cytochrome c domain-containing protein n=1 Tax=Algicella marina TaxID=2683284 RepID=A0A6P1T0I8_9RHOB|nr:c-type cytochrome [Algicella marina]QHQ35285.1 hypothetical protein GO499_08775 [Algicella marina]
MIAAATLALGLTHSAFGDGHGLTISAPDELVATGVFDYILPRFRLKTQIPVAIAGDGDISVAERANGGVFEWDGRSWGLLGTAETDSAAVFAEWLRSEVGQNTLTAFQPDGTQIFFAPEIDAISEDEVVFEGDEMAGDRLAHQHCGRCHVVSERNRMGGISSTPSFGAMKNFSDWEGKFAGFFTLNPHPSFTQIEGFTEPFPEGLPPAIAPILLTEEEYNAILAYVSSIPVKDLGGAIIAN